MRTAQRCYSKSVSVSSPSQTRRAGVRVLFSHQKNGRLAAWCLSSPRCQTNVENRSNLLNCSVEITKTLQTNDTKCAENFMKFAVLVSHVCLWKFKLFPLFENCLIYTVHPWARCCKCPYFCKIPKHSLHSMLLHFTESFYASIIIISISTSDQSQPAAVQSWPSFMTNMTNMTIMNMTIMIIRATVADSSSLVSVGTQTEVGK